MRCCVGVGSAMEMSGVLRRCGGCYGDERGAAYVWGGIEEVFLVLWSCASRTKALGSVGLPLFLSTKAI